ncbi:MAG: hypothetical protein HC822_10480 [Oscillochloris sp.]|nr:hypothetical protein [Oscillochloris sp.]
MIGQEIVLTPENFTVQDSFVQDDFAEPQVRVFANSQAGAPNLPTFAYDITALEDDGLEALTVREVQFIGGTYSPLSGFNPQITQIVTETDEPLIETDTEPTFEAGAGIWFPDKFFAASSVGERTEKRDQLVSAAAQFNADTNGTTGEIRLYDEMIFKVIYIDPTAVDAQAALDDQAAPVIEEVRIEGIDTVGIDQLAATQTRIGVLVNDGDGGTGLDGVSAVYVEGDTWINLEFSRPTPNQAPNLWTTTIPLAPGEVRVIVSATDRAGNTSYYTAKGSFQPPSQSQSALYLPLLAR